MAISERHKIVSVPLAAAVDELLAVPDLLVKIVSSESSSAWPWILGKEAGLVQIRTIFCGIQTYQVSEGNRKELLCYTGHANTFHQRKYLVQKTRKQSINKCPVVANNFPQRFILCLWCWEKKSKSNYKFSVNQCSVRCSWPCVEAHHRTIHFSAVSSKGSVTTSALFLFWKWNHLNEIYLRKKNDANWNYMCTCVEEEHEDVHW